MADGSHPHEGRYLHGRAGPHLLSVATWMFGLVVVLCSVALGE